MKLYLTILMTFFFGHIIGQSYDDYFSLQKNGKKYLKPIKYVFFDPKKDKMETSENNLYFYIKNERFLFLKKKHNIDTCNIKYLKKIRLSDAGTLSKEEFQFYKNKIKNDDYWKQKKINPPMPIVRFHPFFKVFIVKKQKNKILKYEVNWDYFGLRGLKVN